MSKSKSAPTVKPIDPVDWTGVRLQRVEHEPAAKIFAQGDPATSVMYIEKGAVRLSVWSHAGKEAVLALLEDAAWQRVRVNFEPDLQRSGRIHVLLDDLVQVKFVSPHLLVAERLEAEHPLAFRDNGG
jgi:CRP-like cAMP-binding protein